LQNQQPKVAAAKSPGGGHVPLDANAPLMPMPVVIAW